MDDKVIRFPVKNWKRLKNRRGKHSVTCMVSERWLSIGKTAEKVDFGDGEVGTAFFVHVMTDASGEPRKMCELCLTLEDLTKAIEAIQVIDGKR